MISIIVPVRDEEENLRPLAGELREVLKDSGLSAEIIFVNDGSKDTSGKILGEIVLESENAKVLNFTRNFGQTAAISAGVAEAAGDVVITLDADLQNDPADIPRLVREMDKGFDIVSGWRKERKDTFFSRRFPSRMANALISAITGIKIRDYGCTLKAYRAAYIKKVELCGEMHRFLPAILGYMGAKIAEIPVNHRPRTRGKSKYGFARIFKVLLDLLTVKFMGEYISKPIYFFGGASLFFLFFSALFAGITLYKKFYQNVFVKDQPLFLVFILFAIIGVQFALLGLLAEILVRAYFKINGRPNYLIKSRESGRMRDER